MQREGAPMMSLQQLSDRLYRLERRERKWRAAFILSAILACLAVIMGMVPSKPGVIETETLLLTDDAGRVRGLFTAGNDEPSLVMTDSRGVKRLRFRIEDHGPTISLYDGDQNLRLQMKGGTDAPEVSMLDKGGNTAVRIRGSHSEPQVTLFDSEGHARAKFFVLDGEQSLGSGISLVNSDGIQQVLMTALPDGTGVIRAGGEFLAPLPKTKTTGISKSKN